MTLKFSFSFVLLGTALLFLPHAQASDDSVEVFSITPEHFENINDETQIQAFRPLFRDVTKPIKIKETQTTEAALIQEQDVEDVLLPEPEAIATVITPPKRPKLFSAPAKMLAAIRERTIKEAKLAPLPTMKPSVPSAFTKPNAPQQYSDMRFSDMDAQTILAKIDPAAGNEEPKTNKSIQIAPEPLEEPKDNIISVDFRIGESQLDKARLSHISLKVLNRAFARPQDRIQLHAYASDESANSPNDAKRLSLERALEIRNYLISKNIDSDRITLRAMGMDTKNDLNDRVDIVFINI